jgi:transposase InsO family protein
MMEISTSAFYYKPKIDRVEREKRDADLRDLIEAIRMEFPRTGYRQLHHHLLRRGQVVNEKRIRRLLGKYNLFLEIKRRFIRTTDSDHGLPVYPNRLPEVTVTGINQVWVADITYIRILTGFVFLAVILDVHSRRVVGWAISKRIDQELTLAALKMAIETRRPAAGLIHHSDRGVQYCSKAYIQMLADHEIAISMSRKGNPYDNAYAESFMKTLKMEEVYFWNYETIVDVLERIPYFIEEVYNRKRLHSGVGYVPPAEFEEAIIDQRREPDVQPTDLKS